MRVVERYYGREAATQLAYDMEYQGQGWLNPASNAEYVVARVSTAAHPLCAVCGMDVDAKTAPTSAYKGKTYFFCMEQHKQIFDANPARVLELAS